MRTIVVVAMLAISPAALWKQLTRETNSHAASQRGAQQFATKRFEESARSYGLASQLAPSSRAAFNLGTAQIAAGQRTQGAATIEGAMKDPALKEPALYNRGNGALASKAYEHAVRDYTDALRLNPKDAAAKRNLEIALRKLDEQKRQQQQQQQQRPQQSPQQSPGGQEQRPQQQKPQKTGEQDAEALLRSVQQQEQEELARMKRARGDAKAVGW